MKRHDYTAPTESTVDVSVLPKVMQVKNFGKRSQTKYTHLLDQDTTRSHGGFGGLDNVKKSGKYGQPGEAVVCFICGGPHLKRGWCYLLA
jgi:microfibrillar-associated protein 1